MDARTYRFAWQGIDIEASYEPARIGGFAHLEIRSLKPEAAPLPITGTGYRSHFHPAGMVEASGGDVVSQVTAWLDEEAAKPHWRRYIEASRQGEFFTRHGAGSRIAEPRRDFLGFHADHAGDGEASPSMVTAT